MDNDIYSSNLKKDDNTSLNNSVRNTIPENEHQPENNIEKLNDPTCIPSSFNDFISTETKIEIKKMQSKTSIEINFSGPKYVLPETDENWIRFHCNMNFKEGKAIQPRHCGELHGATRNGKIVRCQNPARYKCLSCLSVFKNFNQLTNHKPHLD